MVWSSPNTSFVLLLQIAKDARECVQECVSEFISFITSEASDRCHMEKRKTINGEDILFAMTTLGFDNYVEPLKLYLQKYREVTLFKYSSFCPLISNVLCVCIVCLTHYLKFMISYVIVMQQFCISSIFIILFDEEPVKQKAKG